jgi:hypothetical protein
MSLSASLGRSFVYRKTLISRIFNHLLFLAQGQGAQAATAEVKAAEEDEEDEDEDEAEDNHDEKDVKPGELTPPGDARLMLKPAGVLR